MPKEARILRQTAFSVNLLLLKTSNQKPIYFFISVPLVSLYSVSKVYAVLILLFVRLTNV